MPNVFTPKTHCQLRLVNSGQVTASQKTVTDVTKLDINGHGGWTAEMWTTRITQFLQRLKHNEMWITLNCVLKHLTFKQIKQYSVWGSTGRALTNAEELNRAPPPAWPIAPRFSCSRPWEPEFTKVEAKEGSLASTTRLLPRLREPEGPPVPSDPSVNSKWDTASLMLRVGSGSRDMGGISKTSSPRLGVWNVCYMCRERQNESVHGELCHVWKVQ